MSVGSAEVTCLVELSVGFDWVDLGGLCCAGVGWTCGFTD